MVVYWGIFWCQVVSFMPEGCLSAAEWGISLAKNPHSKESQRESNDGGWWKLVLTYKPPLAEEMTVSQSFPHIQSSICFPCSNILQLLFIAAWLTVTWQFGACIVKDVFSDWYDFSYRRSFQCHRLFLICSLSQVTVGWLLSFLFVSFSFSLTQGHCFLDMKNHSNVSVNKNLPVQKLHWGYRKNVNTDIYL